MARKMRVYAQRNSNTERLTPSRCRFTSPSVDGPRSLKHLGLFTGLLLCYATTKGSSTVLVWREKWSVVIIQDPIQLSEASDHYSAISASL